ncbi:MAG: RlmE family RNA methyltransferase [Euryarchaeota archaeon]|nr:RlmE family RNA methyltransferase [Euryarchaeota archaeon]
MRKVPRDRYYRKALKEGYRSRAAYKLLQMDGRFHLLRPGDMVLDLGAAPGGWSQVAAQRGARVVAVDRAEMEPLPGVLHLVADVLDPSLEEALQGLPGKFHLLLSDMAPKFTGARATDHARQAGLAHRALDLAQKFLRPGGGAVIKLFRGAEEPGVARRARGMFQSVRLYEPPAKQQGSAEVYLVAEGRL